MNEQGKKSKSFLHCFESQVILPIKYAPPGQYFDIGWQSSNILRYCDENISSVSS